MKKHTTYPLSSFPAQMLFRSYITVDVSSLMLGCLNCNYANTDCPLTRRIDNSTALAATARYGYGYLTTFEYAWENVRKFIIGFTLPLWNYGNLIRFKVPCIHYDGIRILRYGPQIILNSRDEEKKYPWRNTIDIFSKLVCIGCWLNSLIVPGTAKQSVNKTKCYYCLLLFSFHMGMVE